MRTSLMTLMLVVSCTQGPSAIEPTPITWDRDTCTGCSMVVSDHRFAAEVRSPTGAFSKFDDIGCALKWLDAQKFSNDPATRIWVVNAADGKWLDAKQAKFTAGQSSPMGFNYGASASGDGLDFDALKRALAKPSGATP